MSATLGLDVYADRCEHGYHLTAQHPTLCACTDDAGGEWAVFLDALRRAARGGRVQQRHVRPIIRGRIEPKHIGTLYRRARAEGLLVEIEHERSDDVAGKNAGRLEPVYELRAA